MLQLMFTKNNYFHYNNRWEGKNACLATKQKYNRKHKPPPLTSAHLTVSVPLAKIHTSRLTLLKKALRYTTLLSGWTQVDHYKEEEILLCHLSHHGNKSIISHSIYIFGNSCSTFLCTINLMLFY